MHCTYAHPKGTSYDQSNNRYSNFEGNYSEQSSFYPQQYTAGYGQSNNTRNTKRFRRNFVPKSCLQAERNGPDSYDQGYQYVPDEYPPLSKKSAFSNYKHSVPLEKEHAFLSLIEMITGMEQKFSNQIAVMQSTIDNFAPQVSNFSQPLQGHQLHYQSLGQNPHPSQHVHFNRSQSQT